MRSSKMKANYLEFTREMRQDYTILVPNMLPMHFRLIAQVLKNYGYTMDLLETTGPQIAETGLRYVHNDTCYPAILVIGQFLNAIRSGRYNPHKVALMLFQTGGGCRASNYISLLRKALEKAGYGYVPVISFSLAGIEKHSGFQLTMPILHRMAYGVLYGDLLMLLVNQCKPYELNHGDSEELARYWTNKLAASMQEQGVSFKKFQSTCRQILQDFASLSMDREQTKIPVGVVGEIFVKYSPLGNNNLEQFLVDNGAEVVIPGLLDFCMYCVYNNLMDYRLYRRGRAMYPVVKFVYRFIARKQQQVIDLMKQDGHFRTPTPFDHTVSLVDGYIHLGAKMGEGWLLTAEMLELADMGVKNIVCTQPFGCLPNHICGKGMMKPIKDRNPDVNIVAIDYDAGATKVNQENRLKLMLANAKRPEQDPEIEVEVQPRPTATV